MHSGELHSNICINIPQEIAYQGPAARRKSRKKAAMLQISKSFSCVLRCPVFAKSSLIITPLQDPIMCHVIRSYTDFQSFHHTKKIQKYTKVK